MAMVQDAIHIPPALEDRGSAGVGGAGPPTEVAAAAREDAHRKFFEATDEAHARKRARRRAASASPSPRSRARDLPPRHRRARAALRGRVAAARRARRGTMPGRRRQTETGK